MKGLIACKAAFFVGGNAGYWDIFDALQSAFFVQNQNIGSQDVIDGIIRETKTDFEQWRRYYYDSKTMEAVEEDFLLTEHYGIHSVPCLIINGKYPISGAQPLPQIIHAIYTAAEETGSGQADGASCRLEDGKMNC